MVDSIGHMYLREAKQKRADGSVVTYLQLAENVWNAEKRRSETPILCNCGRRRCRCYRAAASAGQEHSAPLLARENRGR